MFNKRLAGIALATTLAFATGASAFAQETTTTQQPQQQSTVDLACMATATTAHESSLSAAFDIYANNMKSAYAVRSDAIQAAWKLTDSQQIRNAISAAMRDFSRAMLKESNAMRKSQRDADKQYRTASETCGVKMDARMRPHEMEQHMGMEMDGGMGPKMGHPVKPGEDDQKPENRPEGQTEGPNRF